MLTLGNAEWRWCTTIHKRFGKKSHKFEYELPYFLIDVKTLDKLNESIFGFSYNRFNLFSIFDRDYLMDSKEAISKKLEALYKKWQQDIPQKILMLTLPRFFKKSFNPITFYFGLDDKGNMTTVSVEVTNTYLEKHVYFLKDHQHSEYLDCVTNKEFHVSPFLSEKGEYRFRIRRDIKNLDIHIQYREDEMVKFYANLCQKAVYPATSKYTVLTFLKFPLAIWGVFTRILKQAAILHWGKKILATSKPVPNHPDTLRPRPATLGQKIAMGLFFKLLKTFNHGQLVVILPDGTRRTVGKSNENKAEICIREFAFFTRVLMRGELGFGEAYVKGEWDSSDVNAVLTFFLKNTTHIEKNIRGFNVLRWVEFLRHGIRHNSIKNSRKNIQEHYDLSNKMYAFFLDKGMNYSCAFYENTDDSLEKAQLQKLKKLTAQLDILKDHHVLEIGSGWGDAAIFMAKTYACKVTTLTLSQAQFDYVKQRIREERLEDKVTIVLEDYRTHKGQYDRVLSIEMIEAVGYQYLPTYFKAIDHFLKPNGLAVIQAITIPDQVYERYRKRSDWIQTYIFPGGHLPSIQHIQNCTATYTDLIIENMENIGPHYARTLYEWRKRFMANSKGVLELGFAHTFLRKWTYYFHYCEVGFKNRYINTFQIRLTRPLNQDLIREDHKLWRREDD